MVENRKISIRFFDDREVRAVWDVARAKWFFSVVDIVGVLTERKNAGKYWSVLKTRMKKEYVQLTTKCSRLKLLSTDGKRYLTDCLPATQSRIEAMPETTFDEIVSKYAEMNFAHPFMEGNGRRMRIWLDVIFKRSLKKCVDWSCINENDCLDAMVESHSDGGKIRELLKGALTDKIADREMFMKGIDSSSYYYGERGNA